MASYALQYHLGWRTQSRLGQLVCIIVPYLKGYVSNVNISLIKNIIWNIALTARSCYTLITLVSEGQRNRGCSFPYMCFCSSPLSEQCTYRKLLALLSPELSSNWSLTSVQVSLFLQKNIIVIHFRELLLLLKQRNFPPWQNLYFTSSEILVKFNAYFLMNLPQKC